MDLFNNKITEKEAIEISPLVFAYIGDAVYEVLIRNLLITNNRNMNVHKLHMKATEHVKAKAQCDDVRKLMEFLTEKELGIFRRGRNSKSYTSPKNATIGDYRMATGFEALIGYLYLTNQEERINELINYVVK